MGYRRLMCGIVKLGGCALVESRSHIEHDQKPTQPVAKDQNSPCRDSWCLIASFWWFHLFPAIRVFAIGRFFNIPCSVICYFNIP